MPCQCFPGRGRMTELRCQTDGKGQATFALAMKEVVDQWVDVFLCDIGISRQIASVRKGRSGVEPSD